MSAANSSNATSWCSSSPSYSRIADGAKYVTYFGLMPIYAMVCLFGQIVCLAAFGKQTKKDTAFGYQLYLAISKTIEVLTFAFFSLTCKWWSDIDGSGADWFKRSYGLTWIASHLAIPSMNWAFTTSLFLSIAMSADRVVALWRPLAYNKRSNKAISYAASSISIALALVVNLFDVFRFVPVPSGGHYYVRTLDQKFVTSSLATSLSSFKTVVRCAAVGNLITLNFVIVRLYHKKVINAKIWIMSSSSGGGSNEREKQRRANEKTLTVLAVVQSVVTVSAILPLTVYYAIVFVSPPFSSCPGPFVATVCDAILQVAEMTNFGFLLIFCRSFRTMADSVFKPVRCGWRVCPTG